MHTHDSGRVATRPCGTLYLVATPIGNLSDISERAVWALREVDFIAAEDTRVTRKLLSHLGIKKPLISYRAHNRHECGDVILSRVLSGENCAVVTDAGTPGVCDPGEALTRLFIDAGVPIVVIPGPCAAIAALAASGFPSGRFVFEGFLPSTKRKRLASLEELRHEPRTIIFYEAPHRLVRTLTDMRSVLGDRAASISRELTKVFEETIHIKLSLAIAYFEANPPRGEFVIVIEGVHHLPSADGNLGIAVAAAQSLINSGLSARDAVKRAALETGCSRNELYKAVVK